MGPLLCSNSMDQIGKKSMKTGENLYVYKNEVKVPPLAMVDDLIAVSKCGNNSLDTNIMINTEIDMKNLRLDTPKLNGTSKCHAIHVGKRCVGEHDLKVNGWPMELVRTDSYLGDILSYNGKIDSTISERVSKGMGLVSQIFDVLKDISWGSYYFIAALTLREAILINGMLYNSEVWYGLKQVNIDKLERIDSIFFNKLFRVTSSCPREAFYLETGAIPFRLIIRSRRLKYLHHLVTRSDTELLSQIFYAQWRNPLKNDWVENVKDDLRYFDLNTDLLWIKTTSKNKFKKLVNEKLRSIAWVELNDRKSEHENISNLKYLSLGIQKYLTDKSLSKNQVQLLFKSRNRMTIYWENYKGWKLKRTCPLCNEADKLDTQLHSFSCAEILKTIKIDGIRFSDIYSDNISLQLAKTIEKIEVYRENKLK